MPIAGETLLRSEGGELAPEFFQGLTRGQLEELLDAFVAEGYTKADAAVAAELVTLTDDQRDAAALDWAYVRAYGILLGDMAGAKPASASFAGQFAVSITGDQFAVFTRFRQEHLAAFRLLVPGETPATALASVYTGYRTIRSLR